MKHEKEWHTCDRCGAEIEKPKIWYDRIFPYLRTVNLKKLCLSRKYLRKLNKGE